MIKNVYPLVIFSFLFSITVSAQWSTVGNAGFSPDKAYDVKLAVDGSGNPHVAFKDAANGRKATVMKFDGSNWVTLGSAGFSAGATAYLSLAFDKTGVPHVAYQDSGNGGKATVMKYDAGSWSNVGNAGFSQGGVEFTTIAFDSQNRPYVAYQDWANGAHTTVMRYDSSVWKPLGAVAFSQHIAHDVCLAIDQNDKPYVVFANGYYNWRAHCMAYNSGTGIWETQGYRSFSYGGMDNGSIAVDGNGTVYFSYRDAPYGARPAVMKFSGSQWDPVDTAAFHRSLTDYNQLALSPTGGAFLAYVDKMNSNNLVVKKLSSAGVWAWELWGTDFNGGAKYSAIAVAPSGVAYVGGTEIGNNDKITVKKFDGPVSISDVAEGELRLYPNPVCDELRIEGFSKEGSDVAVYDLMGREVLQVRELTSTINVSSLRAGIYTVHVRNGASTLKQRIIKL